MSKFTRFFEAVSPSFLFESIYINSYSDLDCYVIKEEESTIVLFKDLEQKRCQETALELFNDKDKFNEYYDNFRKFLNKAKENSEELVKNNKLKELIELFLEFLQFYRYTEAFYTELSYKIYEKNSNEVLGANLKKLEIIKTDARKYLNSFFNGQESYLIRTIKQSNESQLLHYSSVEEIRSGKKCSVEDIEKRKLNHVLSKNDIIYLENSLEYQEFKKWKESLIENTNILKGTAASKGIVKGKAFLLSSDFTNFDELENIIEKMPNDVILVSETTAPDIVKACFNAKAIVTNQGGMGSHAAIISRELKIPCVVGCKIATKVIKAGDIITVDGNKGEVILNGR